MKLPKGPACKDCGHKFKKGDTNVYHWKEEDIYRCFKCATRHFGTEVYSRIVGYYSPVRLWGPGKKEEWKDRVDFKVDKSNKETKIKINEDKKNNKKS